MNEVVARGGHEQESGEIARGPVVGDAVRGGEDGALLEHAPDAGWVDALPQLGCSETLDDSARATADGETIGADGGDIDGAIECGGLGGIHRVACIAAINIETFEPVPSVENLGTVGNEKVERDVFTARDVPEEPGDRMTAAGEALYLFIGQTVQHRVLERPRFGASHLLRVEERVLGQEQANGAIMLGAVRHESPQLGLLLEAQLTPLIERVHG